MWNPAGRKKTVGGKTEKNIRNFFRFFLKGREMRLGLFFLIFLLGDQAPAQNFCNKLFDKNRDRALEKKTSKISFGDIGFSQNFLGHVWANYKLEKLKTKYNLWLEANPRGNREQYILEQTRDNPFPTFRDLNGQLRIFDKHHKYKAYQVFMGKRDFPVYVTVFFDYTKPNPRTSKPWKRREMITHANQNGFFSFFGLENPRFRDLRGLPKNIEDLPDLPIRSLISFIFKSLPLPLSGSDFRSMIQFKLAQFMMSEGIKVHPGHSFSKPSIDILTQKFLGNPKILQFLLDRINPQSSMERRERVSVFLREHLDQF